MKWVFLAFLIVFTPLLAVWLKQSRKHAPKVWALLGFLPFVIGPWDLYIAPISWATWPGFVRGVEVSLLDAIALAAYASAPGKGRLRLKLPFLAYIAIVLLSAVQASVYMAALFYAWQLARMFLLFAAVAAVCRDERAPFAILSGLVLGLTFQAVIAAQAFLGGAMQTGGSFGHQNLLGLVSHMVVFPALALLLSGKGGLVAISGPIAGVAVAIFTASRATIGLAGAGLVGLVALSMIRKPTARKSYMVLLSLLALTAAVPLALGSLEKRFAAAPLSDDYDERAAFERSATMMLLDRPLGVGANQFVSVANTGGYFDRGGVIPSYGSRSAHVHNVYLLVAAETGYLGLVAIIVLLFAPILVALRCAFRFRNDNRSELLLGLGFSLVIVALHSLYEWVFVTFNVQHVFAITVGLIVGVAGQLGYWSRPRRSSSREKASLPKRVNAPADPAPVAANTLS